GIQKQLIYKLRRRQRGWQSRGKARALHEVQGEGLFVTLQHLLPTSLTDNHTLPDLPRVRQEFGIAHSWNRKLMRAANAGCANRIAVVRLVHPLDEIARLLRFDREEIGGRDIQSRQANARLISSAR